MKYNVRLNREQAVSSSTCSRALQLGSSFSAFTSPKLSLCHYFHAGTPHVNLFQDLLHFGRKYLHQNMRNILRVLCLSILGLICKADGLVQCHTVLKNSYTYVNPQALLKTSPCFSLHSHHKTSAMIMDKFVHVQL